MYELTRPAENKLKLSGIRDFDLKQIFECGQAFRFNESENGSYRGVAFGESVEFYFDGGALTIVGDRRQDAQRWINFFDLESDYGNLKAKLKQLAPDDSFLCGAIERGGGIRILRQEPWECICSFIISQNNNIPRIKKIIERISFAFGENLGGGYYSFPSALRIVGVSEEELTRCGTGFRARYILDAAEKYSSGALKEIFDGALSTDAVCDLLRSVRGIGPKVSSCIALFALSRLDAFPVDVWIKKVISEHYPNGSPLFAGPLAGLTQQYLFYKARENL